MFTHTYSNLRYGIAHSRDFVCQSGHVIHGRIDTIFFEDVIWC
jgi:hypothetical protein